MNRRSFLKGLVAIGVAASVPVQLVSSPVMSVETSFAEQYARNLHKLASQRKSRLKLSFESGNLSQSFRDKVDDSIYKKGCESF